MASLFVALKGVYFFKIDVSNGLLGITQQNLIAAFQAHLFFGGGRQMIINGHLSGKIDPIFFTAKITVDAFPDEGPAAGSVGGDECFAHAGAFQQAQGQAFTIRGQDDAIRFPDKRADVVGLAQIGNDLLGSPFFYLCFWNGDGIVLVEESQDLATNGQPLFL